MTTPNHCAGCSRKIAPALDRYLIRGQHIVCAPCMHGSTRNRRVHDFAAPDCAVPWHDVWDHSENFVSGPRDAVERMLTTVQETSR